MPIVFKALGLLLQVKGFPTINFVSKSGVVSTYSGERSEEDLIKYVKNQSSSGADHTEL